MNGIVLQAFIKINEWFKARPKSVLNEYIKKGITVEDIAEDIFLQKPRKLTKYGVNFFRKIAGL